MLNENVLYSYPKASSASGLCRYCEKPLGFRLFNRSSFCSEEHANAAGARLQLMMVARIRESGNRFGAALLKHENEPKFEPSVRTEQALTVIAKY